MLVCHIVVPLSGGHILLGAWVLHSLPRSGGIPMLAHFGSGAPCRAPRGLVASIGTAVQWRGQHREGLARGGGWVTRKRALLAGQGGRIRAGARAGLLLLAAWAA